MKGPGQGVETPGIHLPWNRAQRRRHTQAKAIAIHLYAGEASKEWCLGWPADAKSSLWMFAMAKMPMLLLGPTFGDLQPRDVSLPLWGAPMPSVL